MKRRSKNQRGDRAIGDLDAAAAARRQRVKELPMSERLARAHSLTKQLSAIKGVARPR
jgi:hypothetical protein